MDLDHLSFVLFFLFNPKISIDTELKDIWLYGLVF